MNRHAYALCVLERFWRCLKRREVFAAASTRWRDPQAALLDGSRWQGMRAETLTALGLPESPDLITPEELAALMRVNPTTVTRWVRDYGLKTISVGPRLRRFLKEDVREFLLYSDELSDSSSGEVSDG